MARGMKEEDREVDHAIQLVQESEGQTQQGKEHIRTQDHITYSGYGGKRVMEGER